MPNYIDLIGCHTLGEAYVDLSMGDPTVYGDLIWISTPILQATLDALPPCPTALEWLTDFLTGDHISINILNDQIEIALNTDLDGINGVNVTTVPPGAGDVLAWSGSAWNALTPVTELDDLTDVTVTSPVGTQKLQFTGGQWINVNDAGPPPSGSNAIIQLQWNPIVPISGTASIAVTSVLPVITDGVEIWSDVIDIQFASSTIRATTSVTFTASNAASEMVFVVYRDTTPVGAALATNANKDQGSIVTFVIYDVPGAIGNATYSCRVGKNGGPGTWYINTLPTPATPLGGLLAQGAFTIEEIGVII